MSESGKVVVTKLKLDTLADAINSKAESSGAKTIDELVQTVNGIRVKNIWFFTIKIKTPPAKTTYNPGEAIDTTGMVATLQYSNGATKDISSGFTINPAKATVGLEQFVVTYEEDGRSWKVYQNITVNSPVTIGENYVSGLNVADTTVRGITFAEDSYLMVGTDASYNLYKMWMTQNTSGESNRVKANASGTYPAADLAYSNGYIVVPMTTSYGGTLYKNRYLATWNSVNEFKVSTLGSFKITTHASVKKVNRAVAGSNGYVYAGGQYESKGFFAVCNASSGVVQHYYNGWTNVIDLAYGDDILFEVSDDGAIHWTPSPSTNGTSYNGSVSPGIAVKCAASGRKVAVLCKYTNSGYSLRVYQIASNNAITGPTNSINVSSDSSDQIISVNYIGDYIAVIGVDSENNGFIFIADPATNLGHKYMLGFKPLLTCQSSNGIGVLNNANGKYAIARLSV